MVGQGADELRDRSRLENAAKSQEAGKEKRRED